MIRRLYYLLKQLYLHALVCKNSNFISSRKILMVLKAMWRVEDCVVQSHLRCKFVHFAEEKPNVYVVLKLM